MACKLFCAGKPRSHAAAVHLSCRRIVVMNLIMEYVLANAAVCRAFSGYFASLLGFTDTLYFITVWKSLDQTYFLDWWAMGIILVLTCLIIYGTKESATFNNCAPSLLLLLLSSLHLLLPAAAAPRVLSHFLH
jgi:amino acid transporter